MQENILYYNILHYIACVKHCQKVHKAYLINKIQILSFCPSCCCPSMGNKHDSINNVLINAEKNYKFWKNATLQLSEWMLLTTFTYTQPFFRCEVLFPHFTLKNSSSAVRLNQESVNLKF